MADVERQEEASDDAPSTARLEMFSDGVFAIAITLLIIEIRVPECPVVYLVATLIALVSVPASLAILGALAVFYLFPSARRVRPAGSAS